MTQDVQIDQAAMERLAPKLQGFQDSLLTPEERERLMARFRSFYESLPTDEQQVIQATIGRASQAGDEDVAGFIGIPVAVAGGVGGAFLIGFGIGLGINKATTGRFWPA